MFCNYCGATNPADASFCSTCGRVIGEPRAKQDPTESTAYAGSNTVANVASSGNPPYRWGYFFTAVSACFCLVGFAGATWLLVHDMYIFGLVVIGVGALLAIQSWGLRTKRRLGFAAYYILLSGILLQLIITYLPDMGWNAAYRASPGDTWFNVFLYGGSFYYFFRRRREFSSGRRLFETNTQDKTELLILLGDLALVALSLGVGLYVFLGNLGLSSDWAEALGRTAVNFALPAIGVPLYLKLRKRTAGLRKMLLLVLAFFFALYWLSQVGHLRAP